jgi:hypothetical protein
MIRAACARTNRSDASSRRSSIALSNMRRTAATLTRIALAIRSRE